MMSRLLFSLLFSSFSIAIMAQPQQRLLGGDISMLPVYEGNGTVYRNFDGQTIQLLPWLKRCGWNAQRVRLFVHPEEAKQQHKDEGVCQDLKMVTALGRQIKKQGMQLMLDFHYSDTWADPGKQLIPRAWGDKNTPAQVLADSVEAHTRHALTTMVATGATPDLIQVGNEITNGMLWPVGKVNAMQDNRWQQLALMLRAGVKACREVCPEAKIIIHTEKAGDCDLTVAYYRQLSRYGVDYDIIGLSYYPMWHKSIPNLGNTLDVLAGTFPDKPVMIVETAAYYSHDNDRWIKDPFKHGEIFPISPVGQEEFTKQLVRELNRHPNVTGLFWWFPEENESGRQVINSWINRGLFDNRTGKALPAIKALQSFMTPNNEIFYR